MIFSYRSILNKNIIVIFSSLYAVAAINAAEADIGLDINADHSDINLQTSISRLQGNVILKHNGMTVTGDAAELQPAGENQSHLFIISGEPVKFENNNLATKMSARAGQMVYTPNLELMEFQDNVSITHITADTHFEITAQELQITLKLGLPYQLIAKGIPVSFKQQLIDRKIVINADKITWDTDSQLAILLKAIVIDELTTFSADEIKYNTLTGELSATGKGDTRPSYRFEPEQEKEPSKSNDS